MLNKQKNFYQAVAVIIGYVIGVGMFGLPYIVSKTGVFIFLIYIFAFSIIQYMLHMVYANLIVTTKTYHRLPGYANIYLGKAGKYIAFISKMFGNFGALLAYIIISGIFMNELFFPVFGGSEFIYATLVFGIVAAIVFFGIKAISKSELVMTAMLLMAVILIFFKGWPSINFDNYFYLDWRYVLLPYGAMLFALDGNGSLPIVVKLLQKDKTLVKRAVRYGTAISVLIILLFTLIVVGISGINASPDALVGLKKIIGDGVILFSLLFGILTIITSFILVSEAVKETLWWDFKVNKLLAWAIAVFIPYAFYFFGIRNLTSVISLAGGVAGGLSAIILILIFNKLKKDEKKLHLFKWRPGKAVIYSMISLFIAGIIYELYFFVIK